ASGPFSLYFQASQQPRDESSLDLGLAGAAPLYVVNPPLTPPGQGGKFKRRASEHFRAFWQRFPESSRGYFKPGIPEPERFL
ncbi:hypothetical protein ACFL43_05200, partial [Thermodesulfobacteriota bacterium]